jgi:hypothetical protein
MTGIRCPAPIPDLRIGSASDLARWSCSRKVPGARRVATPLSPEEVIERPAWLVDAVKGPLLTTSLCRQNPRKHQYR